MILPKRKLFRMIGLLFPLLYLISARFLGPRAERIPVLALLALFIGTMIFVESWRFRNPRVNRWMFEHFKGFTKDKERERISSTSLFLISAALTILVFPRGVAIAALLFLTVGDPIAEIVGIRYGRIRIFRGKTLEGAAAGAVVCFIAGLPLLLDPGLSLRLPVIACGAMAAAVTELLPVPLDDNFTIPIGSGIAMIAASTLFAAPI